MSKNSKNFQRLVVRQNCSTHRQSGKGRSYMPPAKRDFRDRRVWQPTPKGYNARDKG